MTRKTKAEKAADQRIDRVYKRVGEGVQINMLDIPKVFRAGREAIAEGATDDQLAEKLTALLATIRKN